MTHAIPLKEICQEARLLFALLDAVDSEDLIAGMPCQTRWRALKARINSGASHYENEADESYELLVEIGSSGAISGTWIEKRWLTTSARIQGGN